MSSLFRFKRFERGRRGVVGAFIVVCVRWVFGQVCCHELFKLFRRRWGGSDRKNLNSLRRIRRSWLERMIGGQIRRRSS